MNSWLEKTIDDIHAGIPESAWDAVAYRQWLREMYRALDFLMRSGAWGAINAYMAEMPTLPHERSIAVLRFLPRDIALLQEWVRLRDRVRDALIQSSTVEVTRAMRGLLGPLDGDLKP